MLIHWITSALLLLVVSRIVPGFIVRGFVPALIAALVMGLVNATLGLVLKILTFPLTIVTFGVFLLVINALMLLFTSHLGFGIQRAGIQSGILGSAFACHFATAVALAHSGPGRVVTPASRASLGTPTRANLGHQAERFRKTQSGTEWEPCPGILRSAQDDTLQF